MNENDKQQFYQSCLTTQERRAVVYNLFNQGLQECINKECSPSAYEEICKLVTEEFKACSNDIKTIIENFKEAKEKEIVQILTKLQQLEREKLGCVTGIHLVKKQLLIDPNLLSIDSNNMKEKDGDGDGDGDDSDEGSSTNLERDLKQFTSKHNSLVEEINETLEELKYAIISESSS